MMSANSRTDPTVSPNSKGRRRHQQILDTTLELLSEQGVSGVTFSSVAKRLGISHGGFYHYFTSREDMMGAAAENALDRTINTLELALLDAPPQPALRFYAMARAQVAEELRDADRVKVVNSLLYGPLQSEAKVPEARRDSIRTKQKRIVEIYRHILMEGQARGDFVQGAAAPLTFGALGVLAYAVVWYSPDGAMSRDEIAHLSATQAIRSISLPVVSSSP